MTDPFAGYASGLDSPAQHAAAVTPDDGTDLPATARALWVGAQGDVKVTMAGGEEVTFAGVSGVLPVRVARVWETGTTASDIVAMW